MSAHLENCSREWSGTTNPSVSSIYDVENSIVTARSVVTATPAITMSQPPADTTPVKRRPIDRHELQTHAELSREPMGELHVEAHEIPVRVEERERQRVGQVADAQHTPLANALEDRARLRRPRRRCAPVHGRLGRLVQQLHPGQDLVTRVNRPQDAGKQRARSPDHDDVRTAVMARYRTRRRRSNRSMPPIAHAPSMATVTVCIAATSVPTRELTTPVARNS